MKFCVKDWVFVRNLKRLFSNCKKSIVSGSCGCSQPERPGGFKSVLHDGHGVGKPQDAVSRTSRDENTPDDSWKAVIRRDMIV